MRLSNWIPYIILFMLVLIVAKAIWVVVAVTKEEEATLTVITNPIVSSTNTGSVANPIYTIRHDNHLFVSQYGSSLIHHPSCPCLTTAQPK